MSKLVPYTNLRRSRTDLALCRCITEWRSEPDPTMEQISLFFSFCNLSGELYSYKLPLLVAFILFCKLPNLPQIAPIMNPIL